MSPQVDFLNSIRYHYMDTEPELVAAPETEAAPAAPRTAAEVDAEEDTDGDDGDAGDGPEFTQEPVKRVRPRELSISIKVKAPIEDTGQPKRRVRSASAVGKLRVSRDGAHSANSSAVLAQIAARKA